LQSWGQSPRHLSSGLFLSTRDRGTIPMRLNIDMSRSTDTEFPMDGFIAILVIDLVLLALAAGVGHWLLSFLTGFWSSTCMRQPLASPSLDLEDAASSISKEMDKPKQDEKQSSVDPQSPVQKAFIDSFQKSVTSGNTGISYSFEHLHLTL
jgi:hypothetical protein